jgi:hypothetical protein
LLNITITKIIINIQEYLERKSMVEKVRQYRVNLKEHEEEMTPEHLPCQAYYISRVLGQPRRRKEQFN